MYAHHTAGGRELVTLARIARRTFDVRAAQQDFTQRHYKHSSFVSPSNSDRMQVTTLGVNLPISAARIESQWLSETKKYGSHAFDGRSPDRDARMRRQLGRPRRLCFADDAE
jgi:hypothetical protein